MFVVFNRAFVSVMINFRLDICNLLLKNAKGDFTSMFGFNRSLLDLEFHLRVKDFSEDFASGSAGHANLLRLLTESCLVLQ